MLNFTWRREACSQRILWTVLKLWPTFENKLRTQSHDRNLLVSKVGWKGVGAMGWKALDKYAEQGRQRITGFPDANTSLLSADVFSPCNLPQERYNPLEPAPQEGIPVLSWNSCF